jgi:hypothetical protein
MIPNFKLLKTLILICLILPGCKPGKTLKESDEFSLYTTVEELDTLSGSIIVVPKIDRYILLPKTISLYQKIDILLDSISKNSFNNLTIEILKLDIDENGYKSLKVNLREFPGFSIPNSLGKYQTWYEYFQGSTGGSHTTNVLIESILQKEYKGDWINQLEFYYQNERIGEWDHIFLSETIIRK